MSSPRLPLKLIPDTIRSGARSRNPSTPVRTQSTGVPSVANPNVPSGNSTSSSQSGPCMVMLRAAPVRFLSGAMTTTRPSGCNARRRAAKPGESMPSSLVTRIRGGRLSRRICWPVTRHMRQHPKRAPLHQPCDGVLRQVGVRRDERSLNVVHSDTAHTTKLWRCFTIRTQRKEAVAMRESYQQRRNLEQVRIFRQSLYDPSSDTDDVRA